MAVMGAAGEMIGWQLLRLEGCQLTEVYNLSGGATYYGAMHVISAKRSTIKTTDADQEKKKAIIEPRTSSNWPSV